MQDSMCISRGEEGILLCAAMIICQSRVLLLFFKPGVQVFFIEPVGE